MVEWKLHFLSGFNAGDEVVLMHGETIVGTDELTADFVLPHHDMYSESFGLFIEDSKIYLTKLESVEKLLINDVEILLRDKIEISNQDNIYVDGFKFCIVNSADGFIDYNVNENSDNLDNLELDDADIFNKIEPKKTSHKIKILTFFFTLFATTILLYFIGFKDDVVKPKSYSSITQRSSIKELLNEQNYKNVEMVFNESLNQYNISGYVRTKDEKNNLIDEINKLSKNASIDIKVIENIIQNVNFVLENFGLTNSRVIEDVKMGYIIISGIENNDIGNNVEMILQNDIPGLLGWKFDKEKKQNHMDEINILLDKYNMLGKVNVVSNGEQIDLFGDLTLKEKAIFDKINSEFVLKFGDVPRLILKNNHSNKKVIEKKVKLKLEFNVKSVNFNNIPYVILTNDRRYTKGMQVPSGHVIEDIDDSGIMLIKDKVKTFIKFKVFDG